MKGIILAGGTGSRLYPLTLGSNKHLLPIYQKPMICYSLSILMLAGIKEVMLITTREDLGRFKRLLGDGSSLGINLEYAIQETAGGIAEAFLIAEPFIGNSPVALILGDNIFHGPKLRSLLERVRSAGKGATIFGCQVKDPERFGVVAFDDNQKVTSIEEKPVNPKSNVAVTGLYFYDHKVTGYARQISKSERGELEITDINKLYLENGDLSVELLGEECIWMDVGTHQSFHEAGVLMKKIELEQGIKVACLEEIAFELGHISRHALLQSAKRYKNEYGHYLNTLAKRQLAEDPRLRDGRQQRVQ